MAKTSLVTAGGVRLLEWDRYPCRCVKDHRPTPAYSQRHHIIPLAAGGADTPRNTVPLCGSGHDWVHDKLREFARNGGPTKQRQSNPYLYRLAVQGWEGAVALGSVDPRSPSKTLRSLA